LLLLPPAPLHYEPAQRMHIRINKTEEVERFEILMVQLTVESYEIPRVRSIPKSYHHWHTSCAFYSILRTWVYSRRQHSLFEGSELVDLDIAHQT